MCTRLAPASERSDAASASRARKKRRVASRRALSHGLKFAAPRTERPAVPRREPLPIRVLRALFTPPERSPAPEELHDKLPDELKAQRARPQLTRLVSDTRTATLVSGWIPRARVGALVASLAQALGESLPPDELARLDAALEALSPEAEEGLEWRLGRARPVLAHFVPDETTLLAVDVLLEDEHEQRLEAVHGAFAASTVDPRAA